MKGKSWDGPRHISEIIIRSHEVLIQLNQKTGQISKTIAITGETMHAMKKIEELHQNSALNINRGYTI